MSSIEVSVSVVNSSGILAEVNIASGNNFIVATNYDYAIATPAYSPILATLLDPYKLLDTYTLTDLAVFFPKPNYTDSVTTSDSSVQEFSSVQTDSATTSDSSVQEFLSVRTDSVTTSDSPVKQPSSVQTDSVTTSDSLSFVLAVDSGAANEYAFNNHTFN